MAHWNIEQTPNRNLLVIEHDEGSESVISLSTLVQVSRVTLDEAPSEYSSMDSHIAEGRFGVVARIDRENYRFYFNTKEEQEALFLELRSLLP